MVKKAEPVARKKGGPKPKPRASHWMPEHCTVADLSRIFGVSGRTVRDLDQREILKHDAAGIRTLDSIHAYLEHLRKAAAGRTSGEQSLAEERAKETQVKREIGEMKLMQLRGEMLTLSEVSASWSSFASAVKAAVLSIPSKARAKIPHLTAHDAESLKQMCRDILIDLSEEVKAAVIAANERDISGK